MDLRYGNQYISALINKAVQAVFRFDNNPMNNHTHIYIFIYIYIYICIDEPTHANSTVMMRYNQQQQFKYENIE